MQPLIEKREKNASIELEVKIEELEDRIAPDGGETVLPLTPDSNVQTLI
jgi:hypothetical protein